jgi:hypothetical protein
MLQRTASSIDTYAFKWINAYASIIADCIFLRSAETILDAYPIDRLLAKVYGALTFILEHPNKVHACLRNRIGGMRNSRLPIHFHPTVVTFTPSSPCRWVRRLDPDCARMILE